MEEQNNQNISTNIKKIEQQTAQNEILKPKRNLLLIFIIFITISIITTGTLYFLKYCQKTKTTSIEHVSIGKYNKINETDSNTNKDNLINEKIDVVTEKNIPPKNKSLGLFYPYDDGYTINNSKPTVIGKIAQTKDIFLKTEMLEKEISPFGNHNYLKFKAGKIDNLIITINGKKMENIYGFAQWPGIYCFNVIKNKNDITGKDIEYNEKECINKKRGEIPPLIFIFKPTNNLSQGSHNLNISYNNTIIGTMNFTINNNFSLSKQKIANNNIKNVYDIFEISDTCPAAYWHPYSIFSTILPLPKYKNSNLYYAPVFPKNNDEKGDKNRRVVIKFKNEIFDLFFPSSEIFFEGKTFDILGQNNFIKGFKALYLPNEYLYYKNNEKAETMQINYPNKYFEILPLDISGFEYEKNILPWTIVGSTFCDG